MIDDTVMDKIISIPDSEKGGDNALDGFEFQLSSAIYLMFKEIKNKNSFALIYEKIEDFIIFTDQVHLYQAKSISRSLTPNVLYTPSKKTKNNNSPLSIIEKMHDNYESVKQVAHTYKVDNNLVICENQNFSTRLTKIVPNLKEVTELNFELLDAKAKSDIISNTKYKDYNWCSINAIRLIPKNRHEEVTRIFIENVIHDIMGENKINSLALYNSLTNEIKRIRKAKSKLTYEFIMKQINKFSIFEDDLKYSDYVHLLNEEDRKSILICKNFDILKNVIKIKNHPNVNDFEKIKRLYTSKSFNNLDNVFNSIMMNDSFNDLCLRLNEYEIKALILIVIAKEIN